jgi:hypothetical protein
VARRRSRRNWLTSRRNTSQAETQKGLSTKPATQSHQVREITPRSSASYGAVLRSFTRRQDRGALLGLLGCGGGRGR